MAFWLVLFQRSWILRGGLANRTFNPVPLREIVTDNNFRETPGVV